MTCVCIVCPVSCRITVEERGGELAVTGNQCPRGKQHAVNEYRCPQRVLTTTVRVKNGLLPRLPVISAGEIPKERMGECLEELYRVVLEAPVRDGETVVKDICGTGVDIVASRAMKTGSGST